MLRIGMDIRIPARIVAAALCLGGPVAGTAQAQMPDRLSILAFATHLDAKSDFETFVPGVVLTWEGARLDVSLAAYSNSYGRGSVAGVVAWPVWRGDDAQVDLFAGAALYPRDGRRFAVHLGDWVPIGGVQARWRYLFAQAIPSDGVETDAILSVGLTFPLGRR